MTRSVRRTVGKSRLTILGEEGGALLSPRHVATIIVDIELFDATRRVDLNRSDARALRDALDRILGEVKP